MALIVYGPNEKQSEEARQKAVQGAGQPGVLDKIIGRGPYMAEYKRRKNRVREQYWRENRAAVEDLRRQERKLKKSLKRAKEEINRKERVELYEFRGDERLAGAKREADKKYGELERGKLRDFRRTRQEILHKPKVDRDKGFAQISRDLRKMTSQRAARGFSSPNGQSSNSRHTAGGFSRSSRPSFVSRRAV